jgi:hypothetical protein
MEGRAHAAACSLGAQRALCDSNRPAGARRGGLGGGGQGSARDLVSARDRAPRDRLAVHPARRGSPRPRVPAGPSPRRTPSARGRGAGRLARPRGRPEGMAGPGGQGHAQACGLWAGPGLSPLAPSDPRSTRPSLRGLQCGAGRGPACDPAGQGDFSPAGAGRRVRRCVPPGGQGHPCTTSAGRPVGRSVGRSRAGRADRVTPPVWTPLGHLEGRGVGEGSVWFEPQRISLSAGAAARPALPSSPPPTTARPPGGPPDAPGRCRGEERGRRRRARGWTTPGGPGGGPPVADRVPLTADRVTFPGGGGGFSHFTPPCISPTSGPIGKPRAPLRSWHREGPKITTPQIPGSIGATFEVGTGEY